MDDFINQTSALTDVVIYRLLLVNSQGTVKDLTKTFDSISIFEDIFAYGISGTITIQDGNDIPGEMEIHGNEFITISFGRPGATEKERYSKTFRVYKISDRQPLKNIQSYTIHFCSEEIIFSNQMTITKTFKDSGYTGYVREICGMLRINGLKLNPGNFENAQGTNNVTLTAQKPFDAIDLFAKYSFNDNNSTFLFFENRDGFNFLSLDALFARAPITKLKYSQAMQVLDQSKSPFQLINEIQKFRFPSTFDIMKNVNHGAYSGTLYTLDLITQKYTRRGYSLTQLSPKNFTDGLIPVNAAKNRNEKSMLEEFGSNVNYQLTNLEQKNSPYFVSRIERPLPTNIERTLMQRKMQLALLENASLECMIPGNVFMTVGAMVEFDMPSFTRNEESSRYLDPFMSGKYLIASVRHVVQQGGKYNTVVKLVKNSSSAYYSNGTDSENYKKVRNL
jgi:hypothetical protein